MSRREELSPAIETHARSILRCHRDRTSEVLGSERLTFSLSLSLARLPPKEKNTLRPGSLSRRLVMPSTRLALSTATMFAISSLSLSPFTHPFALLHRTLKIHLSLPLSHARKYTFVDSRRHHCLSSHDDDSPRLPPRETDCRGVTPVRERSRPVRLRDELASSMTAWLPGVGSSRDRGDRGP